MQDENFVVITKIFIQIIKTYTGKITNTRMHTHKASLTLFAGKVTLSIVGCEGRTHVDANLIQAHCRQ